MPPYGEPDWAAPGSTTTAPPAQAPGTMTPAPQNANPAEERARAEFIIALLSMVDFGLAVAMGALGVLTILDFNYSTITDYTEAFLGGYMIVFALMLFTYEFIWWTPVASINKIFRRNFGFMYGLRGKGLYLICIAFLCLGLIDSESAGVTGLDWGTGIGWLAVGCIHLFIGVTWPDANDVYKPPTAGFVEGGGAAGGPPESVV